MPTLSLKKRPAPDAPIPVDPAQGLKPPNFPFWLVWRKNSIHSKKRHLTLATATAECHRLAEEYQDRRFYVLAAVGYTQRPPTKEAPE